MKFDTSKLKWIHQPQVFSINEDKIEIITEPNTDFWQKTYYGFEKDNAPALLVETDKQSFSFIVKTDFENKLLFDQCGIIIYQDSENWAKASIEYENNTFQKLGSVVTNHGYSDWATTDITADAKTMFYRLSRRGSDFCIENSFDAIEFTQMRIFHLFEGSENIRFGIYACSPEKSSFKAAFSEMELSDCTWQDHKCI